ncbi:ATP-binding protein [Pseudomonadota bacterium]
MTSLYRSRKAALLTMLVVGGVVPILGGYLLNATVPDWRWVHHESHHLAEGVGAFSAFIIGGLLLAMKDMRAELSAYTWLAYAFFGMGILDGFHSILDAGQGFVWLHSTATFVGGGLAVLVWLPDRLSPRNALGAGLYITLIGATTLGILSLVHPASIPAMVENGSFTNAARQLNIVGGLGFIVAALFFARNSEKLGHNESLIFSTQAFLFGVAGMLFELSELWDGAWWLWHALRLIAYMVVVAYFFSVFMHSQQQLRKRTHDLGERVKEMRCLYSTTQALEQASDLDKAFQIIADTIPPSWQYPEITHGRLSVLGQSYVTEGFQESPWRQNSDIYLQGDPIGCIEVFYAKDMPDDAEGPFMTEERALLDEMASRIGQFLDKRNADNELNRYIAQMESANKELETFAYSVSHDLRAPLRAIDGFSQALIDDYGDKFDGDAKLYLERLRAGSQKMSELIDGILKLSRSTRGEMASENVNLSEIASKIVSELKELEPDRSVSFAIAADVIVLADPRLIRAALENIIGNAWKFTQNTPEAMIEFKGEQNGDMVTCCVRDNGAGFDMAYADKLFAPFQRLHRQDEFEGTGIGLSTAERIVHRHGGRIWAEGGIDEGATFFIELQAGRA